MSVQPQPVEEPAPTDGPLLSVRDLHVTYRSLSGAVPAVRGVSFDLDVGQTLGIAGESGCGKSTMAGALLRLLPPDALGLSAVIFGGEPCDPAAAIRWGTTTLALQAYGPTEAAVCAMIARAGPHWRPALLGRPLAHQIVLLSTAAGVRWNTYR